jgi:hypothetical protein
VVILSPSSVDAAQLAAYGERRPRSICDDFAVQSLGNHSELAAWGEPTRFSPSRGELRSWHLQPRLRDFAALPQKVPESDPGDCAEAHDAFAEIAFPVCCPCCHNRPELLQVRVDGRAMRLCCNILGVPIVKAAGRVDLVDADLGVTPSVGALSVAYDRALAAARGAK